MPLIPLKKNYNAIFCICDSPLKHNSYIYNLYSCCFSSNIENSEMMIKIFNNQINKEIIIDDDNDSVAYIPRQYEQGNEHIIIELKGINLLHHSKTCNDCKAFIDVLGTINFDWHIEIDGKIERLNLTNLGKEHTDNMIEFTSSRYFNGTKLKLKIDTDTIKSLEETLKRKIKEEKYDNCTFIRDKINILKKHNNGPSINF
jgi:hypothetical protein